jgi:lauroyl/myristoyl acyltransferase
MTAHDPTNVQNRIVPDMFVGPKRLHRLMPLLRRLPPALTTEILASAAIGQGLVKIERCRRALAWATAHGARGTAKWRLAVALLANHGRFVAQEAMVGISDLHDLRCGVVVEGAEHLRAADAGAILLGFHLGPPRTSFVLRALGYPVHFAGRLEAARDDARWDAALEAGDVIRLPGGTPRDRVQGLYRIRNLLHEGKLVYLTADGPFGREAFRIDVPGGSIVVRVGWLALRRQTRMPTLPVLTYRDHDRRVIVIHAPLPDPDEDARRDTAACQAALGPLVDAYVRRFPSQCRYVALPRWSSPVS